MLSPFFGAGEAKGIWLTIGGQAAALGVIFECRRAGKLRFSVRKKSWLEGAAGGGLWRPLPVFAAGFALTALIGLGQAEVEKVFVWLTGKSVGLTQAQDLVLGVAEARRDLPRMLLMGTTVVVFAPLVEELFFRGIVYPFVRSKWGIFWGILVTGLLFGAIHASIAAFLPLAAFGALLCLAYECSGDIRVPVLVHSLFNLNSFLTLLAGVPPTS